MVALLATAASTAESVPPALVEIVASLAPLEARPFELSHAECGTDFGDTDPAQFLQRLAIEDTSSAVAVANIARLGLWRRAPPMIPGEELADRRDEARSSSRSIAMSKGYPCEVSDITLYDDLELSR